LLVAGFVSEVRFALESFSEESRAGAGLLADSPAPCCEPGETRACGIARAVSTSGR